MCEFVLRVVMYPGKINTFIFSKNSVTFNSKNGSYFMLKPVVINSSQKKYFGVKSRGLLKLPKTITDQTLKNTYEKNGE